MATTTLEELRAVTYDSTEKSTHALGNMGESQLEADMYFLKRDSLYDTEKPYGMRYYADGVAQSNVRREKHKIVLNDMRQLEEPPSVGIQGFSVMQLESRMAYEDFNDYTKIKSIYHEDLVLALKKNLGAEHVFVMDNAVFYASRDRQQAESHQGSRFAAAKRIFQSLKEKIMIGINQPLCVTLDSDFTRDEAVRMLTTLYGKRASEILTSRWQVINVWKPLRGPLRDWPLGIVDSRTVDFENDTIPSDVVFPTWVTENMQVMYSPSYQWYYLSDQMPNEAIIFKSADSNASQPCACPHAGFNSPKTRAGDLARESIDCRAFVLYADLKEYPWEVGKLFEGIHGHMV